MSLAPVVSIAVAEQLPANSLFEFLPLTAPGRGWDAVYRETFKRRGGFRWCRGESEIPVNRSSPRMKSSFA